MPKAKPRWLPPEVLQSYPPKHATTPNKEPRVRLPSLYQKCDDTQYVHVEVP